MTSGFSPPQALVASPGNGGDGGDPDLELDLRELRGALHAASPHNGTPAAAKVPAAQPGAPAVTCTGLDRLAGLDAAVGLSHVMGQKPLYLAMLRRYVAGQRGVPRAIRHALASGDWAGAERLAHACRGVSATIGARGLPNVAGALEHAFKHRMPPHVIAAQMMEFELLLVDLVSALEAALPPEA